MNINTRKTRCKGSKMNKTTCKMMILFYGLAWLDCFLRRSDGTLHYERHCDEGSKLSVVFRILLDCFLRRSDVVKCLLNLYAIYSTHNFRGFIQGDNYFLIMKNIIVG